MGWVEYTHVDGKRYRYSDDARSQSGRPFGIQYWKRGRWVEVRNMDIKDSVWSVSLGLAWEHRPTP